MNVPRATAPGSSSAPRARSARASTGLTSSDGSRAELVVALAGAAGVQRDGPQQHGRPDGARARRRRRCSPSAGRLAGHGRERGDVVAGDVRRGALGPGGDADGQGRGRDAVPLRVDARRGRSTARARRRAVDRAAPSRTRLDRRVSRPANSCAMPDGCAADRSSAASPSSSTSTSVDPPAASTRARAPAWRRRPRGARRASGARRAPGGRLGLRRSQEPGRVPGRRCARGRSRWNANRAAA